MNGTDKQYLDALERLGFGNAPYRHVKSKVAWIECSDARFMVWIIARLSVGPDTAERKKIVRILAEHTRKEIPKILEMRNRRDQRPLQAVAAVMRSTDRDGNIQLMLDELMGKDRSLDVADVTGSPMVTSLIYARTYTDCDDAAVCAANCIDNADDHTAITGLLRHHYPVPPTLAELEAACA